jgi:hypothetical protein
MAGQARLQVTELRDFDLKLAFQAPGALRKDVEDKLAPVDDPYSQSLLQVAGLNGAQRMVENSHRSGDLSYEPAQLRELAAADKGARIDGPQSLE